MDESLFAEMAGAGVDIEGALKRMIGNKDLYARCIQQYLEDATMAQLEDAIARDDEAAAMTAAHTLKGLSGNLGFLDMYETSSQMVALYREDNPAAANALLGKLQGEYQTIIDIVKKYN